MNTSQWKNMKGNIWVMEFEGKIVNAVQTSRNDPDHVIWTYDSLNKMIGDLKSEGTNDIAPS